MFIHLHAGSVLYVLLSSAVFKVSSNEACQERKHRNIASRYTTTTFLEKKSFRNIIKVSNVRFWSRLGSMFCLFYHYVHEGCVDILFFFCVNPVSVGDIVRVAFSLRFNL